MKTITTEKNNTSFSAAFLRTALIQRFQELDPGFFISYLRRTSRPRAQLRPLQPPNRRGVSSSSPTRPARPPARRRRGCRCPGRRSLAPRPGLPAPFFSSPGPGFRQGAARDGGRPGRAGGPGRRRPAAPRTRGALTGHAQERKPHRSAELLTTAQPPRPARRHLGKQARPLACVITSASQGQPERGRRLCCPAANEERQPPPLGQSRLLQQLPSARSRRATCSRSLRADQSESRDGKIASRGSQ